MNAYTLPITCPTCAGDLEHQASGTTNGASTRAVARCATCRREWLVTATIVAARGVNPAPPVPAEPTRVDTSTELHEPIGPRHPVIDLIMAATGRGA